MTLIVEDGTGRADAQSYASVSEADAYHLSRYGPDAPWLAYDPPNKENYLIRATDKMLEEYRGSWKGYVVQPMQALDWPRMWVYPDPDIIYALPSNVVPAEVKNACAELALRAGSGDLTSDVGVSGQVVQETIGPISVTYDRTEQRQIDFAKADKMIARLRNTSSPLQATARLG